MGIHEATNDSQTLSLDTVAPSIHLVSRYSRVPLAQETVFVGRERELALIAEHFNEPNRRLLTLVGLGGIGKTRIAWESGARLAGGFAHGAYFIALTPIDSPGLIVTTLAASLGYIFHGHESPLTQLLNFLRKRELLLVLDNFEHLLGGIDIISELLQAAPGVRMLLTSRERLNIREEWVLEISGLEYPVDETDGDIESNSGIQLFLQCARRARPDFMLTKSNKAEIVRICRLVEGVPLGIELAASWVRALSCRGIGDGIERSLDFLTTNLRNAPEQHRSMRAVFSRSYDFLTAEQRQVFNKLSVFRGGFAHEAAGPVANASPVTLAALVDKSLLRLGADGRYDMHELLRQFGTQQLDAIGASESTRESHCNYYAGFVSQRVEDLKGRRQQEAGAEFNADFENVRTAWTWAAAAKRSAAIEQMLEGLWVFSRVRDREVEVAALCRDAEPQFAPEYGDEPQRLWGRLLARVAEGDEIQPRIDIALRIARRYDDHAEIGFSFGKLAPIAYAKRDFARAKQLTEESVAHYRRHGDRYYIAEALFHLQSASYDAPWEEVKHCGEESFRLSREIGDRVGMAWSISALAIDHAREGRFAESERLWFERIALGYEIGNLNLVALGRAHLCQWVYFVQGEFVKTRASAEEALQIATALDVSNTAAWATVVFGLLASMEERYPDAIALCTQAASAKALAWVADLAAFGSSLAACGLGEYDAARESFAPSIRAFISLRGAVGILTCLPVAAILLAHNGNPVRAVELLGLAFTHLSGASGWMGKWPLLARLRAELEQSLGPEAYAAAWASGRRLDIDIVVAEVITQFQPTQSTANAHVRAALDDPLTTREVEILRLAAEGLSNRDIAARLFLSPTTIKWYLSELYSKLGVRGRMEAVAAARALHMLP